MNIRQFNTFPQQPHGPFLPMITAFYFDFCPCSSNTRLGNDTAAFYKNAPLEPSGGGMLHYLTIIQMILQLVICRDSDPCPNHLPMPFICALVIH